MKGPSQVVIVDADGAQRSAIAAELPGEPSRVQARSIQQIPMDGPTVVVFGPSFANTNGLSAIGAFLGANHTVKGILVASEVTTDVLMRAMRSGLIDVAAHGDMHELPGMVERARQRMTTGPATTHATAADGPAEEGKVVVVFGTKGGCGKSFIATNLAAAMAQRSREQVALIDVNLQFGDTAVMLKINPEHTIADLAGAADHLDAAAALPYFVRHAPTGLLVLPGPIEPAIADQVTAQDVTRVVQLATELASMVVIDTPGYFTDVVLAVLDIADEIVLVAGMDVPNIKNTKLGLNTMKQLDIPDYKIKLVLNRTKSKAKMDVGDVEKVLGRKADALIPSDIVVPKSVNQGYPAVLSSPRSEVARAIEGLASLVHTPARGRVAAAQ